MLPPIEAAAAQTPALTSPRSQTAPVPSKAEIQAALPSNSFDRSLSTALAYTAFSVVATLVPGVLAWLFLPVAWAWAPVWAAYILWTGTMACGVWVIAHECGHDAFCDNKRLQNGVGFVLHSALLVPYYSWQRSHAIHHAKTNHLDEGETHVPKRADTPAGQRALRSRRRLGPIAHATLSIIGRLGFGWPVYLITGTTGGPHRGATNHFWPFAPFSKALFPARWAKRVLASAGGVLTVAALLVTWAVVGGSVAQVGLLYVGPYLVCNGWLVTYTWLHHTSADTPHYEDEEWSYVRGAFCSIDRPYGRFLDLAHHHIGSTHAAHHLFARIPHYRAVAATEALRVTYPELYRFDPTPVPVALWQVAKECVAVTPDENAEGDGWRYTDH